jgi:hypothetical protein
MMRVSEGKGQAFHLLRISGFSHARIKDHSERDCHVTLITIYRSGRDQFWLAKNMQNAMRCR